jgi:hypothetical protein
MEFSPYKSVMHFAGVISLKCVRSLGGYGELHRRENHLTTKDTKVHEGILTIALPLCTS